MDFKNFNQPGVFPEYCQIKGEIRTGEFKKKLDFDNIYDEDERSYDKTFDYSFDFIFRKKIIGTAFVYRGGFYVEFEKPQGRIYKSSHCNHFSMPMCQHYTHEGKFTQYFIDRLTGVLQVVFDDLTKDEIETKKHYLNQRKGID